MSSCVSLLFFHRQVAVTARQSLSALWGKITDLCLGLRLPFEIERRPFIYAGFWWVLSVGFVV
jgi:hypothetical protein